MKTITSRDNAQYKDLKHLATSSQARKKAGQTLLDGVHLCQAYLELRGMPVQCIVSESALNNPEVADIVGKSNTSAATPSPCRTRCTTPSARSSTASA